MYRAVGVLVRDYVYFVWAISVLVWLISFCFIIFCCVFEMGSVDVSSFGVDMVSGLTSIVYFFLVIIIHKCIIPTFITMFLSYRGGARIGLVWFWLSGALVIVFPSSVGVFICFGP